MFLRQLRARHGDPGLAEGCRSEDLIHRARQPLGEWICGELQRKVADELLNIEVFDTLWEAKVLAERWRREYNQRRPHSALAYRPPSPEAKLPRSQALDPIPWSGLQMVPGLT